MSTLLPVLLVSAIVLCAVACTSATPSAEITQAQQSVTAGGLLLDVRTPEEFAAGHLEGAVNVPVQELELRWGELGVAPEREVVVYCRSGARSARAKAILKQKGIERVYDLGAMSNGK